MTTPMTLNQEMEMIRGFDVAEVCVGLIDTWAMRSDDRRSAVPSGSSQSPLSRPKAAAAIARKEEK